MARALTVEQAAEYLQLSPYTVRLWLRSGKIPGRKIGRVYRILESDLEAMVATGSPTHREKKITAASLVGKYPRTGRTVDDFIREKAAEATYLEWPDKAKPRRKPQKLVGKGSLAHIAGLSSENYLKNKREEQEKENQRCPK